MSVDQHRLRQDLTVYGKCPYFDSKRKWHMKKIFRGYDTPGSTEPTPDHNLDLTILSQT